MFNKLVRIVSESDDPATRLTGFAVGAALMTYTVNRSACRVAGAGVAPRKITGRVRHPVTVAPHTLLPENLETCKCDFVEPIRAEDSPLAADGDGGGWGLVA